MGSDFSALDAELDALGAGPVSDALALAATYAGNLAALSDIDAALGVLDHGFDGDGAAQRVRAAHEASAELPNFLAGISGERAARRPRADESEEIVLPDPMEGSRADPRASAQRQKANESGELALDGDGPRGSPRSGSFSLEGAGILPGNRDDTIETEEEELVEADVDLMDLRSESTPMFGMAEQPSAPLFDLTAPSDAQAQEEADAAFAELFADATLRSHEEEPRASTGQHNSPATLHSQPPPAHQEDTEIFDSGGLGYVENLEQSAAIADSISEEELDSAEFEIVMDDDAGEPSPPPHPSQHPSQPPEKRPSFLGRLFGRKEE